MAGRRESPENVRGHELRISDARRRRDQSHHCRLWRAQAGPTAAVQDRRIREGGGDAGRQGRLQQLRSSPLTAVPTHTNGPALRGAVALFSPVKALAVVIALVAAALVALPLISLMRLAAI